LAQLRCCKNGEVAARRADAGPPLQEINTRSYGFESFAQAFLDVAEVDHAESVAGAVCGRASKLGALRDRASRSTR
jgi:hypothetical protein